MFKVNEDKSIYLTRGDYCHIIFLATNVDGSEHKFRDTDIVRFKVFEKKSCENVVLQSDFRVGEDDEVINIILLPEETKIGEEISKPVDYWYEVELNPDGNTETIVGYDEDGPKIFRLYPEGGDFNE